MTSREVKKQAFKLSGLKLDRSYLIQLIFFNNPLHLG